MGPIDIEKDMLLKEIRDNAPMRGTSRIVQAQIEHKFGRLPEWARTRLPRGGPKPRQHARCSPPRLSKE